MECILVSIHVKLEQAPAWNVSCTVSEHATFVLATGVCIQDSHPLPRYVFCVTLLTHAGFRGSPLVGHCGPLPLPCVFEVCLL